MSADTTIASHVRDLEENLALAGAVLARLPDGVEAVGRDAKRHQRVCNLLGPAQGEAVRPRVELGLGRVRVPLDVEPGV
eukprot:CAMPEP_0204565784 /NCGR_PEP_ID=MMETSP0661-20131031/35675_1 /ASSEMBLY_ACC=CAM_ASM_000606 /TAXON_ID=109239 /ORGANISM="Alexandrium margalefi, Strain AMGDE01CS-322" /LENGTH=78 /DNA_ID=CAMNT_0051573567 /DNA_START=61 /DNA_END=294 /DNA_ORIENTATION=+